MVCICTSRHARARKVYSGEKRRPGVGPGIPQFALLRAFAQDAVAGGRSAALLERVRRRRCAGHGVDIHHVHRVHLVTHRATRLMRQVRHMVERPAECSETRGSRSNGSSVNTPLARASPPPRPACVPVPALRGRRKDR